MALSSSESALLTETCTNMNVAANTCREVLEMLRSLGNTGVVDIATHNNAQGSHADDKTLVHASSYGTGQSVKIGSKDGLPYEPLVLSVKSDAYILSSSTYTLNRSGASDTGTHESITRYLSDANSVRVKFANNVHTGLFAAHWYTCALTDADGLTARSGFHFNIGKINNSLSAGSVPAQGSVRLSITSGTMSQYAQPLEFNSDGIVPTSNNAVSLGVSGYGFKDLFVVNSPTVTSDRRAKKDISALGTQAVAFVKALRPVSFKLVEGEGQLEQFDEHGEAVPNGEPGREGVRTHWGFIAQEVKAAMELAGIEDAAVWCLADKEDPYSQQSLRYDELLAPLVKAVQVLAAKVEALEAR